MDVLKANGNETFLTVTEILNNVFNYKISKARRSTYEIKQGKIAAFIYKAVKQNGKWVSPNKKAPWVNILDDDGKCFTRIEKPINDNSYVHRFPDKEFAVFMKTYGGYSFYGVFERGKREKKNRGSGY
jgi:hypothetical protein